MTSIPQTYDSVTNFNVIQTFYADPDIVNKSGEVTLTSVDLYFKTVPTPGKPTASGLANPGVVVYLCEVKDDEPDIHRVHMSSFSRLTASDISSFSDASGATTFPFRVPTKVDTGKSYGIIVKFEDPGFELWTNVAGDKLVGTNQASPGSNLVKDGKLFDFTNAGAFKARADRDLKFAINCTQYTSNTASDVYVPQDYEFFTITTNSGRFIPGEWVYQMVANSAGTISFTANTRHITSSALFSGIVPNDRIVLFSNTSYRQVVVVKNVANTSYIETNEKIVVTNTAANWMVPPMGKVHKADKATKKLYLNGSNAKAGRYFQANANVLVGEDSQANATITSIDDLSVDRVSLRGDLSSSSQGIINASAVFAYANTTGGYQLDIAKQKSLKLNNPQTTGIRHYDAKILSRSKEILNAGLLTAHALDAAGEYSIYRKSFCVNTSIRVAASNVALYKAPSLPPKLDCFTVTADISNTYTTTDANSVTIDSEVAGPYNAISKHITKKVTFANNKFAEDCRVYMTAYRPKNSDILVYTRVHNSADSDAFDDHAWTPLEYKDNVDKFSSSDNEGDFIEYELGLPLYHDAANTLPCTLTTTLSSNSVTVSGGGFGSTKNMTNYLAAGDVVRLYNPLIPEDYIIDVVSAATNTAITLENSISNNNVVGTGFKVDRLKYYHAAFNNITNDNVARYYNSSKVEFDKFDSMQIKIVFLSDNSYIVPKVDQIQVIGVSA
jgi:hypothetical protein